MKNLSLPHVLLCSPTVPFLSLLSQHPYLLGTNVPQMQQPLTANSALVSCFLFLQESSRSIYHDFNLVGLECSLGTLMRQVLYIHSICRSSFYSDDSASRPASTWVRESIWAANLIIAWYHIHDLMYTCWQQWERWTARKYFFPLEGGLEEQ